MPAPLNPPFAAKRPEPMSAEAREQTINQFLGACQQVRRYENPCTCPLNEFYNRQLRDRAISMNSNRRDACRAMLELDDRLTGRDFLTEAMRDLISDQVIPQDRVRFYLTWAFFDEADVDPRLPLLFQSEAA